MPAARPFPPTRHRPDRRSTRPRRRLDPAVLLPPDLRSLRAAAIAAALADGRPVRPDTVTLVLAAKAALDEPLAVWTPATVQRLLWVGVLDWCEQAEVELPLDVPEALWAVAEAVAGADPDRRAALVEPLVTAGGLGDGGRRRHPSGCRAG